MLSHESISSDEDTIRKNGIMGARIQIAGPEKGMYLILGNGYPVDGPVQSNEGEIVMRLSATAILATLPFHGYLRLKTHPHILKAGPVTVDIQRFNRTIEMLTNDTGSR